MKTHGKNKYFAKNANGHPAESFGGSGIITADNYDHAVEIAVAHNREMDEWKSRQPSQATTAENLKVHTINNQIIKSNEK